MTNDAALTTPRPRLWSITPFRILTALAVLFFFLGFGSCIHYRLAIRHLDNPLADLVTVNVKDPKELETFRTSTLERFVRPAQETTKLLVALRKESRAGTILPNSFEQRKEHLALGLLGLMEQAKRERIPKPLIRPYQDMLVALAETHRSLRALEEALAATTASDRERAIHESVRASKSSSHRLRRAEQNLQEAMEAGYSNQAANSGSERATVARAPSMTMGR